MDMDAEFLVYLLSNTTVVNLSLEPLLSDCKNLMKTFLNCTVAYVFREANRCADRLARLRADLHSNHLFCITHHLWWKTSWLVIKLAIFVTDLRCLSFIILAWLTKK